MYIMGEDPVTTFPDSTQIINKLKSLDFLVVQDIFLTETAKLANVVLPATSWGEKDGTFTNAEGLSQKVFKLTDPTGQAIPDWMILKNLALSMGKELKVRSLLSVQEEIKNTPPIQSPGSGSMAFNPVEYNPVEKTDSDFPFNLVIRDVLQHSGSMSTSSESLDLVVSEALLEINEKDAKKFGIMDNTHVKIASKQGSVFLKAMLSEEVPEGTVFVPAHFPHSKINNLTQMPANGESPIIAVKIEAV